MLNKNFKQFKNFCYKNIAFLALGSNLGNRTANLNKSILLLKEFCEIEKTSQIYQSPCINDDGLIEEKEKIFLNAVVKVKTSLDPDNLLEKCKNIEKALGRKPKLKNFQAREIDIDIITYNNDSINKEHLIIPHKEMFNRLFVLKPILDIDPNFFIIDRYTGKEFIIKNIIDNFSDLFHSYYEYDRICYLGKSMCMNIGEKEIVFDLSKRPLAMGIINCTPDSFSGGMDKTNEQTLQYLKANKDNLDIIDIGGESTRPGSKPVDQYVEFERIANLIEMIRNDEELKFKPISVDTRKSFVAFESIQIGANIINDVSGGTYDPEILKVASKYQVPYICMHSRGTPEMMGNEEYLIYNNLILTIKNELETRLDQCRKHGIVDWNIIVDPGVGFAKKSDQNYELIKRLDELKKSFPNILLLGASRKKFIREIIGKETIMGDAAITTHAISKGVNIIRAHDFKEIKNVLNICEKLYYN